MRLFLLLPLLLVVTACSATLDMPTDWAKLGSGGYINSGGAYDLGHIFVWDMKSGSVTEIYKINLSQLPDVTVDRGSAIDSYSSSVSKDTEIDVSADTTVSEAVTAEAKDKFVKSTNVTLSKYNTSEFQDKTYTLNSPALRKWRESLFADYPQYATEQYRFILIAGVDDGSKIDISFKHDNTSNTDANLLKVGKFTFDVTYNDDAQATLAAVNQAPLVIVPYVYRFKADNSKTPIGLQFYSDLDSGFNFQQHHP
jgi:hypothetical protein